MTRRLWTTPEDERLLAMRAAGKTHEWIAADLGRPLSSIASRLETLRIKRTRPVELLGPAMPKGASHARLGIKDGGTGERKSRKCLCCRKPFLSAHAGNRLCNRCKSISVSPYALAL